MLKADELFFCMPNGLLTGGLLNLSVIWVACLLSGLVFDLQAGQHGSLLTVWLGD